MTPRLSVFMVYYGIFQGGDISSFAPQIWRKGYPADEEHLFIEMLCKN